MKKIVASVVAVSALAVSGLAYGAVSNQAGAGVVNSYHDMTRVVTATADSMGRVCVYCHAPHHAQKDERGNMITDNYPLWNHAFSGETFTPYAWATPLNEANAPIVDLLAGPSRLCMSCHDGVTAIDEHGTTNAGTWKQTGTTPSALQTRANLTADLSTTHPIGFDYNAVASARNTTGSTQEIVESTNKYASAITAPAVEGQYATVTRDVGTKTIADNLFGGNIMTCATCHEVHNKENVLQDKYNGLNGSNSANRPNYFLYAKQTDSLICLSCHIK